MVTAVSTMTTIRNAGAGEDREARDQLAEPHKSVRALSGTGWKDLERHNDRGADQVACRICDERTVARARPATSREPTRSRRDKGLLDQSAAAEPARPRSA
jgi:hypothetical protein